MLGNEQSPDRCPLKALEMQFSKVKDTSSALFPLPAKPFSGIAKETTGSKSFGAEDEKDKFETTCVQGT